jgi:hypothetical protein
VVNPRRVNNKLGAKFAASNRTKYQQKIDVAQANKYNYGEKHLLDALTPLRGGRKCAQVQV